MFPALKHHVYVSPIQAVAANHGLDSLRVFDITLGLEDKFLVSWARGEDFGEFECTQAELRNDMSGVMLANMIRKA